MGKSLLSNGAATRWRGLEIGDFSHQTLASAPLCHTPQESLSGVALEHRVVAAQLIEGFQAEYLLADRGYDTDAIICKAVNEGVIPVIPPRKNRKHLREYDEYLYKLRHLVENAFLLLKKWRGIATRYAKNASSFAAAVQIRCIAIWLLVY